MERFVFIPLKSRQGRQQFQTFTVWKSIFEAFWGLESLSFLEITLISNQDLDFPNFQTVISQDSDGQGDVCSNILAKLNEEKSKLEEEIAKLKIKNQQLLHIQALGLIYKMN